MARPRFLHLKVVATILLSLTAVIGTADAGNAATLPVLHALNDDHVHKCNVIGEASGYQAVVCVNLPTGLTSYDPETWEYYGSVEGYCQTDAGVVVQCANMKLAGDLNTGNGKVAGTGDYECGHTYGSCPAARAYVTTVGYFQGTTCNTTNPDSLNQGWMIAEGDYTAIELPVSDKTFSLSDGLANDGVNESSGHYYICL